MNKQELIERLKDFKVPFGDESEYVKIDTVIKLASELDEQQKVTIPQFVADWYEENKDDFERNLFRSINTISSMYEDEELNEFEDWVIGAYTKPFQTLVNMHQFGYEVEKEKRYLVKMKGIQQGCDVLNHIIAEDKWCFLNRIESDHYKAKHTKKQLEEGGFGDVFNSPLFEVEEVK